MKSPVKNGKTRIDRAINFIAETVYPEEFNRDKKGKRAARKRVTSRISRAYTDDVFGKAVFDRMRWEDAAAFYTWASNNKEWKHALKDMPLPINLSVDNVVHAQKAESSTIRHAASL